jgi:hypothetical protein
VDRIGQMPGRVATIAIAAAVFAGFTGIYSRAIRRPINAQGERRGLRRRSPEPRLSAFPVFVRQCGVFALIAWAGRKALRLRL